MAHRGGWHERGHGRPGFVVDPGELSWHDQRHDPRVVPSGVPPKRSQRRPVHHDAGHDEAARSEDDWLADLVRSALTSDERLDASDISVRVEEGVCILEGQVSSQSDERLAQRIAKKVPGVLVVDDRLTLRGMH